MPIHDDCDFAAPSIDEVPPIVPEALAPISRRNQVQFPMGGVAGPAGPAGPAGAAGPAGPAGPAGAGGFNSDLDCTCALKAKLAVDPDDELGLTNDEAYEIAKKTLLKVNAYKRSNQVWVKEGLEGQMNPPLSLGNSVGVVEGDLRIYNFDEKQTYMSAFDIQLEDRVFGALIFVMCGDWYDGSIIPPDKWRENVPSSKMEDLGAGNTISCGTEIFDGTQFSESWEIIPDSGGATHPFQVKIDNQNSTASVDSGNLFLSLRPNHKENIVGGASMSVGAGDKIWLGITFNKWGHVTWAGIDSSGSSSFDLSANAWSGGDGYCEDDGSTTDPFHQTSRKLIAYITGSGGALEVNQVMFHDQILRNVCIDGKPARYPFDHEGGYPL